MSVDWSERKHTPPSERGVPPSGRRGEYCGMPLGATAARAIRKGWGMLAGSAKHGRPRRRGAVLPPALKRHPPLGGGRVQKSSLHFPCADSESGRVRA